MNSVFSKNTNNRKLSATDIKKIIPDNAVDEINQNLQLTHIEWRWRFFNINKRKLIEISKKSYTDDRLYVDNSGAWIRYQMTDKYDKYVIRTLYYYAQ